jgi:hypothetical protein
MDHWGDPWADDDADAAPPKQDEVAKTSNPSFAAAPVLLNSFLDDAQWGSNDDEGFGGWETSIANTDVLPTPPVASVTDPGPTLGATKVPEAIATYDEEQTKSFDAGHDGWGCQAHSEEALKEVDNVLSETSDSATTIQPGDGPQRVPIHVSDTPQPDEALSTRTSTAPSDISHTEAPPIESPRTSFEDERIVGKTGEASAPIKVEEAETEVVAQSSISQLESVEKEDAEEVEFGDFEEDTQREGFEHEEEKPALGLSPRPKQDLVTTKLEKEQAEDTESELEEGSGPQDPSITAPAGVLSWTLEQSLMGQLFPASNPSQKPLKDPEELISTTATRKAWYRLTRKSTMREYNTGIDDENYVRVTWANSHIKEEAKKIIHRWTIESRNSFRGHSAGASFYWDQSPSNAPTTPPTNKSIIAESSAPQPVKQNVLPLSTNVPAAFNWSSSPLAAHDPWRQDSPGLRSISSPMEAKVNALPEVAAQASRAVSLDLTLQTSVQRGLPKTPPFDKPVIPVPVVSKSESTTEPDPWTDMSSLDTGSHTKTTDIVDEDDGEWGEMVESPATSTVTPTVDFPQSSSHNTTLSTPSTTPKSVKSLPFQPQASRHASPIVRLKGAVSPTSSAFKFNNFGPIIPASTIVEPIGPNLLKRATKNPSSTPVIAAAQPLPMPQTERILGTEIQRTIFTREQSDEFSAFESPTTQPEPSETEDSTIFESSTTRPELSASDSFSAFESAIPPSPTPMSVPEPIHSATSPFSPISDTIGIPAPAPTQPSQTPTDPWFDAASSEFPVANATASDDHWVSAKPSSPTLSAPAPVPAEDAWDNADFSFFERAAPSPRPLSQTQDQLSPSDPWSVFNTPIIAAPLSRIETPIPTPSPKLSIPGGTVSNSEQRKKAEEDRVIADILGGLPDLRYMLV